MFKYVYSLDGKNKIDPCPTLEDALEQAYRHFVHFESNRWKFERVTDGNGQVVSTPEMFDSWRKDGKRINRSVTSI